VNKPTAMFVADLQHETAAAPRGLAEQRASTAPPRVSGARFGDDRRPNWVAMTAAIALGCGLSLSLTAFTMIHVAKEAHKPTVVRMLDQAPPPPPAQPESRPQVETPAPRTLIVAPQPLVPTVASPVQIPAAPAPAPDAPGPVSPAAAASPAPSPPAIASVGDLSSTMLEARPPRYPIDSRRKKEEGTVVLSVLLGTDGRVAEISVARSSGSDRLDRAALEAVRRWRWSPTRRGGTPVMVRGVVEIPFQLTRA